MSRDKARRAEAEGFHARLVESGRIPLLSWHHLEELLGVEHDQTAQYRVDFLQSLPLIAWMRLPHQAEGLGSIVEVLAAEAIAAAEGCPDFLSIRDRARQLLLRTGPGRSAIGSESWVWGVVRPCLRSRHPERDLVAALSPVKLFNDTCTIGELARASIITPDNLRARFHQIHAKILQEATTSVGGNLYRGKIMADEFMAQVVDMFPSRTLSIRELLVSTLIRQGVDYDEIRDDCRLSDLSELGLFRSQLRVVASRTGRSFGELKKVPMTILPSRIIGDALKKYGQRRQKRPGSDLNDAHLSALAAYCDVLYVDKRTAEDFRRAKAKQPVLSMLIGDVVKGRDFMDLLG